MKKNTFYATLMLLGFSLSSLSAQERCILKNPGEQFKKLTVKSSPAIKSVYSFGVGETSGREYLMQQDLLDAKGNFKSSGIFAEDGNKAADVRYTYDPASSTIQKKEVRFLGKNLKEVWWYASNERPSKKELRTKGDTLLSYTEFLYDDKGFPTEEVDFRGTTKTQRRIYEDIRDHSGSLTQTCHFILDSLGNKVPGSYPLTVSEYDDKGMILQQTVYNNKEKRKMLSWVYYKYQLDNDYKIIKRSGFNEEQMEISREEITYTDSSIVTASFKSCGCAAKTSELLGSVELVFDNYGNTIRERYFLNGMLDKVISRKFDEFGHQTEEITTLPKDPNKLIKSRKIFEYVTETTAATAKPKK
jgi:hypothetical protein